jgi:hypothetical protein
MTLDAARLVGAGQALHVTTGPATSYWKTDAMASGDFTVNAPFNEPNREGLSQARNEFRHHDTRSIPALRVQCRYCAPARFW